LPSTVREQPSDRHSEGEREEERGQEVSVYRAFIVVFCLLRRHDEEGSVQRVLVPVRLLGYLVAFRLPMCTGAYRSVSRPGEEDPNAQKDARRYERDAVCILPRPNGPHSLRIVNHTRVRTAQFKQEPTLIDIRL
jgi:hypothetical protein